MSFEADKARLIKELADAQASIRAEFGFPKREDPATTKQSKDQESDAAGKRAAVSSD